MGSRRQGRNGGVEGRTVIRQDCQHIDFYRPLFGCSYLNAFIRHGSALSSPDTNCRGLQGGDKANPPAEEGSTGKSDFFRASPHQGRGKQSFFSEINLA